MRYHILNNYQGEKDLSLSKEINQAAQMLDNPSVCLPANKTMLSSTKRNGGIYPVNNTNLNPKQTNKQPFQNTPPKADTDTKIKAM